jgi:phenylacetic acid degradation operon negative regulatory protein
VWLAPTEIDVRPILDELQLDAYVRAFQMSAIPPTDPAKVIRETFDLDALAKRYRAFCTTWQNADEAPDALVLTLKLSTQWLRIIREDPRVPAHLLPPDWPAFEAQQLFRSLHKMHDRSATAIASGVLDTLAL